MDTELLRQARALLLAEYSRLRMTRTQVVAAPGTGFEWSATVPGGVIWQVQSIEYVFTSSAVAVNRFPCIKFTDGNAELARFVVGSLQAQSVAVRYSWLPLLGVDTFGGATGNNALGQDSFPIPAGGVISSATVNLDIGDAYTGIVLVVRQWSEWDIAMFSEYSGEILDNMPVSP